MGIPEFDETHKILFASAEVVPFAKTGGLADVAGSLPKALATYGNDVRIVMPRYSRIEAKRTIADFPVQVGSRKATAIVREGDIEARMDGTIRKVPVYFIDNYHYFDRDHIYGYWDEAERFAFLSRAVLEMIKVLGFRPDVIHCNDWQTGPIPLLLKEQYQQDPFYRGIATVFTIHNLRYQGNFPKESLNLLGLGDEYFQPGKLEFYGSMSFMKAGLVWSDVLNTVSRTYANEIQHPEYGERFEGILQQRSHDLYGICNGINIHEYNPATDPRITHNFTVDELEGKRRNKLELQREMGLPQLDVPLLGLVSRLVDQKGLDLIEGIAEELMQRQLQLVILGTGDGHYEDMFRDLRNKYPDKIGVEIGFNVTLAQRIYAGCDMFLMPSAFEPCGLGQLISLRYGTIPIVRATGGLQDTVIDYDPNTGSGNGFSFTNYEPHALLEAIERALYLFENQRAWHSLIQKAMKEDHSWNRSAAEYMGLYKNALAHHLAVLTA
ncbi:MAG: glycogen synthase GlgA [Limnochordia bacterium]|nr:glycogen synthase GlgA [Limnochordia bacterium]